MTESTERRGARGLIPALRICAGIAISAAFLYLVFRRISWHEFAQHASEIALPLFLLACCVHPLRFVLTAARWGVFLKPAKSISLGRLFPIVAISFAANNVLPLRAGEAVRVLMLRQKEDVGLSVSVSTVFVERLADLATLLIVFFVIGTRIPIAPSLRPAARSPAVSCGIGAVLVCLLLALRHRLGAALSRYLARRPSRLGQRIEQIVQRIIQGMSAVGSATSMLKVAALSLAVLVPSSPGYVGVFEWAVTTVAASFAIERSSAVAFAVAAHLALLLPITLLGWFCALRMSMLGRRLPASLDEARPEAQGKPSPLVCEGAQLDNVE